MFIHAVLLFQESLQGQSFPMLLYLWKYNLKRYREITRFLFFHIRLWKVWKRRVNENLQEKF